MSRTVTFERCIYCFAPKSEPGSCTSCGYDNGLCNPPCWWLSPGTVLKGRYMVGKNLNTTANELTYLGWDLQKEETVEIVEYYPEKLVTRDITHSANVSCVPGNEEALEQGRQAFFEKAKLFFQCVSRVETIMMDYFFRNNTCYYVRRKTPRSNDQN